ncbi:MAG: hydroxymethylglutaryl-CoA reductase [Gammaproteobacteria bacterium]
MMHSVATIPMRVVGPLLLNGPVINDEAISVPLATFETPLWPSCQRGARATRHSGGIQVMITKEAMCRSFLVEAPSANEALIISTSLQQRQQDMADVVARTSRYCRLQGYHIQQVSHLLYVRIDCFTGDAAGHNMVTKAADALSQWCLEQYPKLRYVTISGNVCTDKKVSAINGILGRGKSVIAEAHLSRDVCRRYLKTTPEQLVDVHIKKNLLGSIVAGSLLSANAHMANMLLAFYLATGQDAANIVEGSQGIVHAEMKGDDCYFSVNIPSVIVGTVGNGKTQDFVQANLQQLGCLEPRAAGANSRRLAAIVGGIVLCGELSLLAAQTTQGELMRSHERLERMDSSPREKKT